MKIAIYFFRVFIFGEEMPASVDKRGLFKSLLAETAITIVVGIE